MIRLNLPRTPSKRSALTKVTFALLRRAFSRATSSAPSEMSVASTVTFLSFAASHATATAMAPLPVHRSSMLSPSFREATRLPHEDLRLGTGNEHALVHLERIAVEFRVAVDIPERPARQALFKHVENAPALLARDDALLRERAARDLELEADDPLGVRRVDVLFRKALFHHGEQCGELGLRRERLFGGIGIVVHLLRLPEGADGALDHLVVRLLRGEHLQKIPGRLEGQHEHGIRLGKQAQDLIGDRRHDGQEHDLDEQGDEKIQPADARHAREREQPSWRAQTRKWR